MARCDASGESGAANGLVAVAEVARPHGLSGEVRLRIYNPESKLLERKPPVHLKTADGAWHRATLQSVRRVPAGLLVRFSDVAERADAERLRGAQVCVPRTAFAEPGPDEFYVCDLEGCRAVLAGQPLGQIKRVATYPTCDAMVIARHDGTELEVPLHEDFVMAVRIAEGIVELRTIEGLE